MMMLYVDLLKLSPPFLIPSSSLIFYCDMHIMLWALLGVHNIYIYLILKIFIIMLHASTDYVNIYPSHY
jgi:hypothetical protein